jgi:hypothetical protein
MIVALPLRTFASARRELGLFQARCRGFQSARTRLLARDAIAARARIMRQLCAPGNGQFDWADWECD